MDEQDVEEIGHADVAVVDGCWQIRLAGEISLDMRPRLTQVAEQVASEQRPVVVDLADVTFMDSSGLGFLARLAVDNPTGVRVRNATGLSRELLTITGLTTVLAVDDA